MSHSALPFVECMVVYVAFDHQWLLMLFPYLMLVLFVVAQAGVDANMRVNDSTALERAAGSRY